MEARWRKGFRANITAEVAFEEVSAIHEDLGMVKPQDVVARARPKSNPLHAQFEWDDHKGAERYREDQARRLLRNLVVVVVDKDEEKEFSPAFVSVVVSEEDDEISERGYVSVAVALTDDELRERALNEALRALNSLRRRYSSLKRFVDILESMESMLVGELRL